VEQRDKLERWCDEHNHKMGLFRTVGTAIVLVIQVVILIRLDVL